MIVKDFITDRGLKREINEDAYVIDNQNNFIIVSDGMGGHEKGDIASKYIVNIFNKYILEYCENIKEYDYEKFKLKIEKYLNKANKKSTLKIQSYTKNHNIKKTMGATIVGMYINETLNKIALFHLGDSRIYKINNNKIEQLTIDHCAKNDLGKANVLSKAIGNFDSFDLEINYIDYTKGDIFFACSDGIYNFIKENQLLDIIYNEKSNYCSKIKDIIYTNGAKDNFTLVIVEV